MRTADFVVAVVAPVVMVAYAIIWALVSDVDGGGDAGT